MDSDRAGHRRVLGGPAVCAALLAVLLTEHLVAHAGGPTVAIIKSSTLSPFERATESIVEALGRDPRQPEILIFDLEGDAAKSEGVLAEAYRANPRVIVTVGSLATAAALRGPSSVPVVFSMVLYPRQSGFLAHSSRGVTGASLDIPLDIQFAYLQRLLPASRRVGVLYHPAETGTIVEAARSAASSHGFTLVTEAVNDPAEAVAALGALMEKVEVVWAVADGHVFTPQATSALILAALRRRIPLIGLSTAHVRSGAVAALYCDYAEVGRQTAELASRVLQGEKCEDIPVAAPRTVTLALNLRTAQHLGMSIAADLEREAGEVVR